MELKKNEIIEMINQQYNDLVDKKKAAYNRKKERIYETCDKQNKIIKMINYEYTKLNKEIRKIEKERRNKIYECNELGNDIYIGDTIIYYENCMGPEYYTVIGFTTQKIRLQRMTRNIINMKRSGDFEYETVVYTKNENGRKKLISKTTCFKKYNGEQEEELKCDHGS